MTRPVTFMILLGPWAVSASGIKSNSNDTKGSKKLRHTIVCFFILFIYISD
jgi:hypothetical protein